MPFICALFILVLVHLVWFGRHKPIGYVVPLGILMLVWMGLLIVSWTSRHDPDPYQLGMVIMIPFVILTIVASLLFVGAPNENPTPLPYVWNLRYFPFPIATGMVTLIGISLLNKLIPVSHAHYHFSLSKRLLFDMLPFFSLAILNVRTRGPVKKQFFWCSLRLYTLTWVLSYFVAVWSLVYSIFVFPVTPILALLVGDLASRYEHFDFRKFLQKLTDSPPRAD